jgi:sec-independent protein translocase protein TatA
MNAFMPPAFYSPGPLEIGIILVVVLIVFGPGKLPDVFRALGSGMRQFKEAANPELYTTPQVQQAAETKPLPTEVGSTEKPLVASTNE